MPTLARAWCVVLAVLLLGRGLVPAWHHHEAEPPACPHACEAHPPGEAGEEGGEAPDDGHSCTICHALAAGAPLAVIAPPPTVAPVAAAPAAPPVGIGIAVPTARWARPAARGPPSRS